MYTAFTTDDRPIHTDDAVNDNVYADQDQGLMAVQHAWRMHLRRILRLPAGARPMSLSGHVPGAGYARTSRAPTAPQGEAT